MSNRQIKTPSPPLIFLLPPRFNFPLSFPIPLLLPHCEQCRMDGEQGGVISSQQFLSATPSSWCFSPGLALVTPWAAVLRDKSALVQALHKLQFLSGALVPARLLHAGIFQLFSQRCPPSPAAPRYQNWHQHPIRIPFGKELQGRAMTVITEIESFYTRNHEKS